MLAWLNFGVWKGEGVADPVFLHLFHDNPASRTSEISTPNTAFFPNTPSRAKISANPASLVAVESRIPSIIFSFSRIPYCVSAKSRIPKEDTPPDPLTWWLTIVCSSVVCILC